MDYPTRCVNTIKRIDETLSRMNVEIKRLKEDKIKYQKELYRYMEARGITELAGIKIDKIKPKIPKIRAKKKKKKDRIKDALELCRDVGIPNPQEFYDAFLKTQIVNSQNSD